MVTVSDLSRIVHGKTIYVNSQNHELCGWISGGSIVDYEVPSPEWIHAVVNELSVNECGNFEVEVDVW